MEDRRLESQRSGNKGQDYIEDEYGHKTQEESKFNMRTTIKIFKVLNRLSSSSLIKLLKC